MYGDPMDIAAIPIVLGIILVGICALVIWKFPPFYAGVSVGVIVTAFVWLLILTKMPRATQLSLFGAAFGIGADGAYAKFTDQMPVTVANGLVRLAGELSKGVHLIASNAGGGGGDSAFITPAVWTSIACSIAIGASSFFITHES